MGGTRFFGKLLIEKLINEGNDVTILTRGMTKDTFQDKVKRIIALRSDKKQMEVALKNRCFEVVYDQLCFSPDDAEIACNLLKGRIEKYIFTSSVFVYAACKDILREEDFNPYLLDVKMGDRKVLSYNQGKRYAEVFFLKNKFFPVISLRLPIIMGSNDYTGRFMFHIKRILSAEENFIPDNPCKMNYINAKGAADFLFG